MSIRRVAPRRAWLCCLTGLLFVLAGGEPAPAMGGRMCGDGTGVVRSLTGSPLPYVSLWPMDDVNCGWGWYGTSSDASGAFSVESEGMIGGCVNVLASKTGYQDTYKNVCWGTAKTTTNDFIMRYDVTGSLGAPAVRAGSTIAITGKTVASPQSFAVIGQSPSGARIDLAYAGLAGGWASWTATYTVASGTPDGPSAIRLCVVPVASVGNCDHHSTLGTLGSDIESLGFFVDSTPPAVGDPAPRPSTDTLLRRPVIRVPLTDGTGSGIDPARLLMKLDGVYVNPTFDVATQAAVFTPSADLALGSHAVDLSYADLAGNSGTSLHFVFGVVNLTTTTGTAAIPAVTKNVNPLGVTPGPTHVTFESPSLRRVAFDVTFTSTSGSGMGTLDLRVDLSGATVEFDNGQSKLTTSAGLGPVTVPERFASLAASNEPVGVRVPDGTSTLADVTVPVPTAYRTAGSTATLRLDNAVVVATAASQQQPLGDPIPNLLWRINGIDPMAKAVQTGGGTDISAGTYPMVRMGCDVDPQCPVYDVWVLGAFYVADSYQQHLPPTLALDPEREQGSSQGCAAGFVCSLLTGNAATETRWTVPGLVSASGYHRLYAIRNAGTQAAGKLLEWQQSYINLSDTSCAATSLVNFGNTTRSLTEGWSPAGGGFTGATGERGRIFSETDPGVAAWSRNYYLRDGKQIVYLARPEYRIGSRAPLGPGQMYDYSGATVSVGGQLAPAGTQLSLTGTFAGEPGKRIDELGRVVDDPRSSYNLWQSGTDGYRRSAVVHTGTEYGGAPGSDYVLEAAMAFTIDYAKTC